MTSTTQQIKTQAQQHGLSSLSDAELIALQLGIQHQRARDLLQRSGTLRNVFKPHNTALTDNQALKAALTLELGQRLHLEKLSHRDVMQNTDTVGAYLSSRLRDLPYETFACLFLDSQHRLIKYEELFRGTLDGASVYPREVVRRCLYHNAAAVILAHNHPSGVAHPSEADQRITERLQQALSLVDVRVLDHFVIGENIVSFSQQGLL